MQGKSSTSAEGLGYVVAVVTLAVDSCLPNLAVFWKENAVFLSLYIYIFLARSCNKSEVAEETGGFSKDVGT